MGLPIGVSSSGGKGKENRPGTATKKAFSPTEGATDTHQAAHEHSDADSGHRAIHHTLGRGAFQAVPGSAVEAIYLLGEIKIWPANEPPKGFIFCAGQEVYRDDYPELLKFAEDQGLIGLNVQQSMFGNGDGVTTFTVPDMRMRFPVGNYQVDGFSSYVGVTEGHDVMDDRLKRLYNVHAHRTIMTKDDSRHVHTTIFGGGHGHSQTSEEGNHNHVIDSFDHTQAATTAVDGTNNRLTGPATHSHSTSPSGAHTHSISVGGHHDHTTDDMTAGDLHDHPDSYTTRPQPFVDDNTKPPFSSQFHSGPPFLFVNYIIRYTARLDFEGPDFTTSTPPGGGVIPRNA